MKKSLCIILCSSIAICYSYAQNKLSDTARLKMHSENIESRQFRTNPEIKYKIDSTIAQQYVVHSGDSLKLDLSLERAMKLRITEENYNKLILNISKINAENLNK
ncbi:MAG: hypothetical protein R3Y51_05625 [Rikenellaceae bacterium]